MFKLGKKWYHFIFFPLLNDLHDLLFIQSAKFHKILVDGLGLFYWHHDRDTLAFEHLIPTILR